MFCAKPGAGDEREADISGLRHHPAHERHAEILQHGSEEGTGIRTTRRVGRLKVLGQGGDDEGNVETEEGNAHAH